MKNDILKLKLIVCIGILLFSAATVQAATFTVTKTADTNDGVCDADCSLREAIHVASTSADASDIIEFSSFFDTPRWIVLSYQSDPGIYDPLTIVKSLEIRGKGQSILTISGGGNRVLLFKIITPSGSPTPTVIFRDLQFADAQGAINNDSGDLSIESCLFIDNLLPGSKYGGGALFHYSGVLNINNSTFDHNEIPVGDSAPGGAISLYLGTATITNSTFVGNSATRGSAFYSEFGVANFVNSTIAYNNGPPTGGASYVVTTTNGTINMTNVTAAKNNVRGNGTTVGRQWGSSGIAQINIKNTIVADNNWLPGLSDSVIQSPTGIYSSNVIGVTSLGHNLIGFAFPNDGFPIGYPNANNDYVGDPSSPLDPLLDQLDDNGGVTETLRPLTGSLSIDHGTPVGAPAMDQRGIARPQGSQIDIGSFELEQTPPLEIVTGSSLPAGRINQSYSIQIVANGGTPPYNFALTAGALPSGLIPANDGLISGSPTQFGTFSFSLTVTDGASASVQKAFQLVIDPPPLAMITQTLPNANQNRPYSLQILAEGGAPPLVFSVSRGHLPDGIALTGNGLLSGVPTELSNETFDVTVTDNLGTAVQSTFFLGVIPALRIPTNATLPTGVADQFYSRQIVADGGLSPYSFSILGGALPNGLTFSPNAVISGIPTISGSFNFIVEAVDSQGIQVQKAFSLVISDRYIVTTTADTNDGVCDAQCSLREAVTAGDSVPGASNVIEFSALFDNPARIFLNSTITISKTTEIRGKGRNRTRISSANSVSFVGPKFRIVGTADAVFSDLRMDDGGFSIFTRSIENQSPGRLTIENSTFQGSSVTNENGGAILQMGGELTVDNSTFVDNQIASLNSNCAGNGGAIAILGGVATIRNSTFKTNISPSGSVIYANGAITIENSTIAYNSSLSIGCSLSSNATVVNESGSLTMTNSTVADNLNNGVSGSALSGNINIKNSIIARNARNGGGIITSPNIGPGVTSQGHNLIGYAPALTAGLPNANSDYVGTVGAPLDPLLLPLAFNGGETETFEPQVQSLSINNGTANGAPATDQRGVARPQGVRVDIGAVETDVPVTSAATAAGSGINVPLGPVSVTFTNVADAGITSQIPIYPAIAGSLPGGYSFGTGLPAFQLTTTANYSGSILICIQTPGVTSQQVFNNLHLFHNENGSLVDRTVSRDFPTRTICAETTSLSPFAVAQNLAPTAANVSISGRVMTANGSGLRNANVVLSDQSGAIRTARTGSFGYYRFEGIEAGQTVILSVNAKLYQFAPQVVSVSDDISELDFLPIEGPEF